MSVMNFIELKEKFEIQSYVFFKNTRRDDYIPYSGSPRKYPYSDSRVILVSDPFSENTFYYEFNIDDIGCAEELPSISNMKGKSVPMVRIWIKRKSIAIQSMPFIVDKLSRG